MIPHIERKNGRPVLMVEDKPFILLAGEVHNSDSSSPSYMEGIWDIAGQLGMNALLLPATVVLVLAGMVGARLSGRPYPAYWW